MEEFEGDKFIRTVLINNVQGLIDTGFDYLAFVIIGQGIEMLGSFFDDKPFDHYEYGLPKKRFTKGITLMDAKYQSLETFLWENLRCGLAHQLKPKREITLTSHRSGAPDIANLYKGDKTNLTYLVVDTLFKDFKVACEKVIECLKDTSNSEIPTFKKKHIHLTVRHARLEINKETGAITEIIE